MKIILKIKEREVIFILFVPLCIKKFVFLLRF